MIAFDPKDYPLLSSASPPSASRRISPRSRGSGHAIRAAQCRRAQLRDRGRALRRGYPLADSRRARKIAELTDARSGDLAACTRERPPMKVGRNRMRRIAAIAVSAPPTGVLATGLRCPRKRARRRPAMRVREPRSRTTGVAAIPPKRRASPASARYPTPPPIFADRLRAGPPGAIPRSNTRHGSWSSKQGLPHFSC